MTPQQIRNQVCIKCEERFGEVVEKTLSLLKSSHMRIEREYPCRCEYCQFIRVSYAPYKRHIHKIKRRFSICDLEDDCLGMNTATEQLVQSHKTLWSLKNKKKQLLENVL